MTESEPIAYGICGLMPVEFRKLTPAEFGAVVYARIKHRDQEREFIDARHAFDCAIAVQLQYPEARPKLAEFMLIKPVANESADPEMMNTMWTAWANLAKEITKRDGA